jgi:hypothetical protein
MTDPNSGITLCDGCQALLERDFKNSPFATYYCEHNQALAVLAIIEGAPAGYHTFGPCTAEEAEQVIVEGFQQGVDRRDADHATKQ